ncbi:DUF1127 domain-containing protein [Amaricoccus macauensis]|uniref:DUF1127 domain-containing protein n=1 Tax=Amaricoccus macauensis TaxID=57001 RepID=UPI003C79986B
MSTQLTHAPLSRNILGHAQSFFAHAAELATAFISAVHCARDFERLNALSDAQLAEHGLAREDLAQHVFRNRS